MNRQEAIALLEVELTKRRAIPYSELRRLVLSRQIDVLAIDVQERSYQIEILYFWDGEEEGPIHISGGIDDGGLSSLMPLTRSFIKAPDGSFVGE